MATAYDAVPYPGRPYQESHPLRLGAHAALLGAPFAPVDSARVLEIACGDGANLIPMAAAFPGARFVGIDLAASMIDKGRGLAAELGLQNLQLEAMDILEAGPGLGEFDYVIAHGVYAWIPQPVRDALMRLIGTSLAPHGVAFVSYNAQPGGHVRQIMRDMLLFHLNAAGGRGGDPLASAISLVKQFAESPSQEPVVAVLKSYARAVLARDPEVLFHDELGEAWEPAYFAEFVAHARRHGLEFLAEADGTSWREELFPTELGQRSSELAGNDVVLLHQYVDFFEGRAFHETLLWRGGRRAVDPSRLRGLFAAAAVKTEAKEEELSSDAEVKFDLGEKRSIRIRRPDVKATLAALGRAWPQAVPIADLPPGSDVEEALLQLFAAGKVQLQTAPWPFAARAGERPTASPLARVQIARGEALLTTLDHRTAALKDEAARFFISTLDGRRDREAIAESMAGRLSVPLETVRPTVDPHLERLAQLPLLTA